MDGLTDLHDILGAVIRAALADEALATGLRGRIAEMEDRLGRLQDRAAKRRKIAKDTMVELDLMEVGGARLYRVFKARNARPDGDR